MADIQIPQRQVPNMQFQGAPADMINALYNRPTGPERLTGSINAAVGPLIDQYYKRKQLQAQAFGEGGPYLMDLLYGKGQPPAPQPQVGGAAPSNGPAAPAASAQTMQPNAAPNAAPFQPSEAIQASVGMGHPDFTGHLNRIHQLQGNMDQSQRLYGPSKFGIASQGAIQKQLDAEKAAMDAETAPIGYAEKQASLRASNSKFATPEQGAAIASANPDAIASAYGGTAPIDAYTNAANKAMEVKKTIASEVSKQGSDSQNIRNLHVLASNLKAAVGKDDLGILGNLKGGIFQGSGGRAGSQEAADMQNAMVPLATGLNTVLSHRFNEGEVRALAKSLIPQPFDTPSYRQDKLNNLSNFLDVMATGNEENVRNVASAITTGAIPRVGGSRSPQPEHKSAPAINSQAQYDALPQGTSYTWNGKQHVKGRS